MKNNKNTNIFVFSYILSILLINPVIRKLINYYDFSFFFILVLYMISGLMVNQVLTYINLKFDFVEKVIKNTFFQYWLFFSLRIENNYTRQYIFIWILCIYNNYNCIYDLDSRFFCKKIFNITFVLLHYGLY
jgi:hypothetical protein